MKQYCLLASFSQTQYNYANDNNEFILSTMNTLEKHLKSYTKDKKIHGNIEFECLKQGNVYTIKACQRVEL